MTGGNSQFYFVTALPNSVDETMQQQLRDNGYSDEQVSAYAAAGGLPYLDNTDTVFGQVYAGMDVVDQIACVPTVKNEDETDTYRPQEDSTVTIYKVTIDNYPAPAPMIPPTVRLRIPAPSNRICSPIKNIPQVSWHISQNLWDIFV